MLSIAGVGGAHRIDVSGDLIGVYPMGDQYLAYEIDLLKNSAGIVAIFEPGYFYWLGHECERCFQGLQGVGIRHGISPGQWVQIDGIALILDGSTRFNTGFLLAVTQPC